jgi:hypothetical protein
MSDCSSEAITLFAVTVEEIQSAARARLRRELSASEIETIVKRLKDILDVRTAWCTLLRQCVEELELESKFDKWLKQVGEEIWAAAARSVSDLPDFDYYALFVVGSTPSQAADAVLLSIGFSRLA